MATKFEEDLRALHGADVIEIKPDGSDGRRFRVVKPAPSVKTYPWFIRVLAGLGMIPLALFIGLLLIAFFAALGVMWIATAALFHTVAG